MKIGILTTGQSPRMDIIPEFKAAIGLEVEIEERGALDNLTWEEVKDLFPKAGDNNFIVTRMKDGKIIQIAKRHIVKRMNKCITDLEKTDVDFMVILCTGILPEDVTSKKLILKPSKLMENMLGVMIQEGSIAVIVPSVGQISLWEERWRRINPNLKVVVESVPYPGTDKEIEEVAEKIAKANVNLVILDCLGYDKRVKKIFQKVTKKPILLPRTLLGKLVRELM